MSEDVLKFAIVVAGASAPVTVAVWKYLDYLTKKNQPAGPSKKEHEDLEKRVTSVEGTKKYILEEFKNIDATLTKIDLKIDSHKEYLMDKVFEFMGKFK